MKARLVIASLLMLAAIPAEAQFARRDIRGADEATIYRSPELRRLDVQLNRVYQRALRDLRPGERRRLVAEQYRWLARRASCGISKGCLVSMYERRIGQLQD